MHQIQWKNWPYKNTSYLLVSLFLFFYFANSDFVLNIIRSIGDLGYVGAFISGILFVSIFTVAPASVILFDIAKTLDPVFVALVAGIGAAIGDYLILRYLKDKVFEELSPLAQKVGGKLWLKLFATPFFNWLIPIIGALIIASPAPDEVGISMLGLSKVKNWHFMVITILLNAVGIFFVVTLAQ